MKVVTELSRPRRSLSLGDADLVELKRVVASLPGGWSVATEYAEDGVCYAGLIDPFGDGYAFAFLLERRADGIGVVHASGVVLASGCQRVGEAMAAVRRMIPRY